MAHDAQFNFCQRIQARWPHLFQDKSVLDCGSLDINGNNRPLFDGGTYLGIDLIAGPNVDRVERIHEHRGGPYGVVISTESLEHDQHWQQSLQHMIDLLAPDGLFLLTCATVGRPEHGTTGHEEWASPGTPSYYRNVLPSDLLPILSSSFRCWGIEIEHQDLYCWGLDPILR